MYLIRNLPLEPIYHSDDFIVYGNDDLIPYIDDIINELKSTKDSLLKYLGIDEYPQIPINLFDNRDMYVEFTSQFFVPAEYSMGNFTNGMINYCYSIKYIKRLSNTLKHELTHLLYQSIWDGLYDRVVWLDEGLAQNLSGEKDELLNDVKFKAWILDKIIRRDKEIPPISYLWEHGNKYGMFEDGDTHKYSGYSLSYLMVRYLIDTKSSKEINELLRDEKKIKELEQTILKDALEYYIKKYRLDLVKDNVDEVMSPEELMDYMNKNMLYGWLDKDNNEHIENLKEFRELYLTNSLEDTKNHHIGTCIEQANLIKYVLERLGYTPMLYFLRRYEDDKVEEEVKMHCFIAYKDNDIWYHFEHSNIGNRGINRYNSLDELLEKVSKRDKDDIRVLTQIPDIPYHKTFKEFNLYVNSFPATELKIKGLI